MGTIDYTGKDIIDAIIKATSAENLELMAIKETGLEDLTFKQQLTAIYADCRPLHNPTRAYVMARQIGQRNIFNIEKLKQEKELIEIARQPSSYFKEYHQKIETDQEKAVKQASTTSSQGSEFIQTKARGGGAQSYEEHDLERNGDESDEQTLKNVMNQPKSSGEASNWTYEKGDSGSWQLVESRQTDKDPVNIQLQNLKPENIEEQEGLPLDTITINSNRSVSANTSSATYRSGKDARNKKDTLISTNNYIKAEAIENLQRLQLVNWRDKILQSFACLFVRNYYSSCR